MKLLYLRFLSTFVLFLLPILASSIGFSVKLTHDHHNNFSTLAAGSPKSRLFPNGGDHLIEFSIGTPPVKVRALLDTGSNIFWSRCKPCTECNGKSFPVFDPRASSTYKKLPCGSSFCKTLYPDDCSKDPSCQYFIIYGDGSFTHGTLSRETITFETTEGRSISVPNIIFGCGYNNSDSIDQAGVVGFNSQPVSIVSQLSPLIKGRFSYCLVPFEQKSSSSTMHFGDAAIISGKNVVSTPLVKPEGYFITLESISIGSKNINVMEFSKEKPNIVIDTGTTVGLLYDEVLKQLANEVSAIMKIPITTSPDNTPYCFKAESRDKFPAMTFNFEGGASLAMRPYNTYAGPINFPTGSFVCLSMHATTGMQIFGNALQQNFHIGYDLVRRMVSFSPTDCSKMSV